MSVQELVPIIAVVLTGVGTIVGILRLRLSWLGYRKENLRKWHRTFSFKKTAEEKGISFEKSETSFELSVCLFKRELKYEKKMRDDV